MDTVSHAVNISVILGHDNPALCWTDPTDHSPVKNVFVCLWHKVPRIWSARHGIERHGTTWPSSPATRPFEFCFTLDALCAWRNQKQAFSSKPYPTHNSLRRPPLITPPRVPLPLPSPSLSLIKLRSQKRVFAYTLCFISTPFFCQPGWSCFLGIFRLKCFYGCS